MGFTLGVVPCDEWFVVAYAPSHFNVTDYWPGRFCQVCEGVAVTLARFAHISLGWRKTQQKMDEFVHCTH